METHSFILRLLLKLLLFFDGLEIMFGQFFFIEIIVTMLV